MPPCAPRSEQFSRAWNRRRIKEGRVRKDCDDRASKGKDISPFHNQGEIVIGRLFCRPGQAKIKDHRLTAVAREDTLSSKVELCMTLGMCVCAILGGARTRLWRQVPRILNKPREDSAIMFGWL
jgi:hypothetical protein